MKEYKAPIVDFSKQTDIEEYIFNTLSNISFDVANCKESAIGAIVVFGFFNAYVNGMVQMKPKENPVDHIITVNCNEFRDALLMYSKNPYDGAIIINDQGQIIGAGVYLIVDDPLIDIPDGCGTRHKSAASFSLRDDVISVLTLSEETNILRVWKNGKQTKEKKY